MDDYFSVTCVVFKADENEKLGACRRRCVVHIFAPPDLSSRKQLKDLRFDQLAHREPPPVLTSLYASKKCILGCQVFFSFLHKLVCLSCFFVDASGSPSQTVA